MSYRPGEAGDVQMPDKIPEEAGIVIKPKVSAKGRRQKGSRLERRVAKAIGGKRTPMSGGSPLGGGDVIHDRYSVECKARAELPALIRNAFSQAEHDIVIGDNRQPLVVLCADRSEPVYCLKESAFLELLTAEGPDNAWHMTKPCPHCGLEMNKANMVRHLRSRHPEACHSNTTEPAGQSDE